MPKELAHAPSVLTLMSTPSKQKPTPKRTYLRAFAPQEEKEFDDWLANLELTQPKVEAPQAQSHFAVSALCDIDAIARGDYSSLDDLDWSAFGLRPQLSMPTLEFPATFAEGAKLVEDCATAVYWLARSTSMADALMVLGTFVRAVTGKSVVHSVLTSDVVAKFRSAFAELHPQDSSWSEQLSQLRDALTRFELVRNSAVFKKVHELILYVLSFGICEKFGVTFDKLRYSRLERESIVTQYSSATNFLVCIIDTILFVCERGVAYMKTGRWTTFLHTGDKYEEWYDKTMRVKEHAALLNDPDTHGFDEPEFVRDLTDVLAIGEAIYEEAKMMSRADKRFVGRMLSEIRMIKATYLNSVQARLNRDVPYSMAVVGDSSIGKSNIVSLLFAMYAKWCNLPQGEEYIYTLMPDDDFWSGFKTYMWGLNLDDMGALKPCLAEAGLDKMLMQLISIVNTVPLVTNQAALEDKGNVPFRGKCVIATANTRHMNMQFVYSYPIAALRRLPVVIEPRLKAEFNNGGMLDLERARTSGLEVPDFYEFTVSRVGPAMVNGVIDPRMCAYSVVVHNGVRLENCGLFELLSYLKDDIARHHMNQAHVRSEREKYVDMSICNCHGLPMSLCGTPSLSAQVGELLPIDHAVHAPDGAVPIPPELEGNEGFVYVEDVARVVDSLGGFFQYVAGERVCTYFAEGLMWVERRPWFGEPSATDMSWQRLFGVACCFVWWHPWLAAMVCSLCGWHILDNTSMPRVLCTVARGFNVLINGVVDAGWRPVLDFLVRQVVRPDSTMRRLYLWSVMPAAVMALNGFMWTACMAIACRGAGVCRYIIVALVERMPVFLFVYLAPIVGAQILSARRVGAIVHALGDREAVFMVGGRLLLSTVASMLALKAAVLLGAKLQEMMFTQGGDADAFDAEAKSPEPHEADVTRSNVWYKDDYQVTKLDVGKMACGLKAASPEQVAAWLARNVVYVESRAPGQKVVFFRALGLTDTMYVTNAHNLKHAGQPQWKLRVVSSPDQNQVSCNVECDMSDELIHIVRGIKDLALFKLPHRPPVKDIMELLPSRTFRGDWNGYRLIRSEDGNMLIEGRSNMRLVDGLWCSRGKPSFEGYCGAAYVANAPFGPQIVALHYMGSPLVGETRSTPLWREDIGEAIREFCPLHVQGLGVPYAVGPLAPKSAVRFIESGHLEVFGSVPSFSANRSRVQLSKTARFFMEQGYKLEHGQPVMRGWEPERRALLGVVAPKTVAPMRLIAMAIQDYVQQVVDEVPQQDFAMIHMVDERTAILGMPGIPHMERLNMSTSAGYPFNGPKRAYITEDGVVIDAGIRAEIDRIKACYVRGERAYPIFNACYKDEPTSFAKIKMCKTRVFLISNLPFTIVCRQLLMGHIRFFTSHRFACEMAIGINCHSEEWGELRDYLTAFGPEGCDDGDFVGFDTSQGAVWVCAAFDVLIELARIAGASDQYLRMLQCLKYDIAFAVVNWFGTLIMFTKQNPSGNSATTQINCLVISVLMRCVLFALLLAHERGIVRFREVCRLIGYGDDSCQNVAQAVRDIYNHITIAKQLAVFGFSYTPAQKDADPVPFRHVDHLSFLKRTWRWDVDVCAWLAPLELKSVRKSLLICLPSKSVCEERRATDCLSSALREMFHHGRSEFEQFRSLAQQCAVVCGLEEYVNSSTFPTYVELQAQFYQSSAHVYARQGRDAPVQVTLPAAQTGSELLLAVQGGTCSKRMAEPLSHVGVPRSRFSPKGSLDPSVFPTTGTVRVDLTEVYIRPAKTIFPTASAALQAHSRHIQDLNPNVWRTIMRVERNTECLCEFCRPAARGYYGCSTHNCPQCERIFAPTARCPTPDYAMRDVVNGNYNRELIHAFYQEVARERTMHAIGDPLRYTEPPYVDLDVQSGEADVMDLSENASSTEDSHVVAHFVDHTEGVNVEYPKLYRDVRDGEHRAVAELQHFLSRPVLIDTIDWAETRAPPYGWGLFQPWYQFFNNATIKYRLNNFSAIACTLRLKFVVNASPFYYGSAIAAYVPNVNNTITDVLDNADPTAVITMSQLPHVWIYPSAQQGGEITCPFYCPTNWLPLTAADTQAMGTLQVYLVNQLQSANGVSGASVTMQIWAWAEDVRLMGPTIKLAVQSGKRDEYGRKPVSNTASATAAVAKSLSRVPVIGPAATAVGDVADAVGAVASLFGFSKVPVVDPVQPFVPKPFANFASTDVGTAVEKLTLDTKNDLAIDPRVAGLPGDDELALQGLLARESYLTSFTYSTTNAVDDLLFASFVKPHGMMGIDPIGNSGAYPLYVPTPLQYFSSMFEFWRGPIVFRFKIVATPFHQGRIRFSWDPVGDISANVPDYASIFNEVVDLAHTSDFEVVVPYMQAIGWCRTYQDTSVCYKSNAPLGAAHVAGADNGVVTIRAVTKLTAPTSSSTINIQVFVRAGDEFEVGGPMQCQPGRTYLNIQSGEKPAVTSVYGNTHQIIISDAKPENHDDLFTTNMGEKVASMRQVMNRTFMNYSTQYVSVNGSNNFLNLTMYQTPFPAWYGYTANGHHTANTQSGTPATSRFNFCPTTPWHYVAACFAGMRGSMQWHFNVDTSGSNVVPSDFHVTRWVNSFNTGNYAETNATATATVNNIPAAMSDDGYNAGGALTNTRTNTGLSVLAPFYNQYRWISTNPWTGNLGNSSDSSDRNNLRLRVNFYPSAANPNTVRVDRYFSIGPDFTFLFFLAAAPYSVLSSVTPA